VNNYSAFLIRCWRNESGPASDRFVAQHVQTGTQFQSNTLDEIQRWIAEINRQIPRSEPVEEEA
jgi:hypothetical protein